MKRVIPRTNVKIVFELDVDIVLALNT
jgi:hypothetical protein